MLQMPTRIFPFVAGFSNDSADIDYQHDIGTHTGTSSDTKFSANG